MRITSHPLPNLGLMGYPQHGDPDIETIVRSPYTVISAYTELCRECGWYTFGGGTITDQASGPGRILSGYRQREVEKNIHSPHRYALAIDVLSGYTDLDQLRILPMAANRFCRVGIYLRRNFMHLDQAPDDWIALHKKARFWLQHDRQYRYYQDFETFRSEAERLICNQ